MHRRRFEASQHVVHLHGEQMKAAHSVDISDIQTWISRPLPPRRLHGAFGSARLLAAPVRTSANANTEIRSMNLWSLWRAHASLRWNRGKRSTLEVEKAGGEGWNKKINKFFWNSPEKVENLIHIHEAKGGWARFLVFIFLPKKKLYILKPKIK